MQVFIVGSILETAQVLDKKRLNKQIIECQQILDALNGAKAWSNHPVVLQYRGYEKWLELYMLCLVQYQKSCNNSISENEKSDWIHLASEFSDKAFKHKPPFHNEEFFNQMKRRLYTKNSHHYSQWSKLGKSEENWYYVDGVMRRYVNGKRID